MGIEPTTGPLSGACLAATGYKSAALPIELQAQRTAQRHMRNGGMGSIVPMMLVGGKGKGAVCSRRDRFEKWANLHRFERLLIASLMQRIAE